MRHSLHCLSALSLLTAAASAQRVPDVRVSPGTPGTHTRAEVACSGSSVHVAWRHLTGGFPATVIDWPSRACIWRRSSMSLPGVETPNIRFVGKCPASATQLLPAKKFAGMSSWR